MKNSEQFDKLLRQALSPTAEPGEDLNQKIINQLKESENMKPIYRKKISIVLIAVVITLTMSVTAAWHLLSPKQVAEHLENETLSRAFESKDAIEINKSAASGGYNFTLHGIVSGEGLSDLKSSSQDINTDRTYAVVSIAKQDGSKMPDTRDEEYGQSPFFVSPLIKGQKPWQINITTMNGGYNEFVIDGVMYRLIECDDVEMFADRGLYLCISSSKFYDIEAFNYNEETGEITPNTDYKGANALFNLPLYVNKADPKKAEKYLNDLLKVPKANYEFNQETDVDWENISGEVIPKSIKEVKYDENGWACYEYNGWSVSVPVDNVFKEGEIGIYKTVGLSEEDGRQIAVQFSKDVNGVITGRVLKLN